MGERPHSDEAPKADYQAGILEDRKSLEIALEAAQLGRWSHNIRTGVVTLDKRARKHYAVQPEFHTIESIVAVIHKDDQARVVDAMRAEIDRGLPTLFTISHRVVHPNGEIRYLKVSVQAEYEGTGSEQRPVISYGTTQDITEEALREKNLVDQTHLLNAIMSMAQVGGWEFDPSTGKGNWTEETCKIHGLAQQPEIAYSGFERFEGNTRKAIENAVKDAINNGTPYDLDLPFTAADGVKKWVRAVCSPMTDEGRVIRLRGFLQDITEKKLATLALERFMAASPAVIYALEITDGPRLVWIGGDLEGLTGWRVEEASAGPWWEEKLHPDDKDRVLSNAPLPPNSDSTSVTFRFRRKDGRYIWLSDTRRVLRDKSGTMREIVGSWVDITERVRLENELRQAQKIEAIGLLAGGIAHDFNNLLTVIMGNSDFLETSLDDKATARHEIEEIKQAAERAAALTRQLLTFSRKQIVKPQIVDINSIILQLNRMMQRLIGEDISIVCSLSPQAGRVLIDPNQFEQAILNLALNARDAMPNGGTLTIRTDCVQVPNDYGPSAETAETMKLVRITLSDTGTGIASDLIAHIFEPFFTTKPVGYGTGLGLPTVVNIVKQAAGRMEVASEVGKGTSMIIYFPQSEMSDPKLAQVTDAPSGHESILIVDDDDAVRRIAGQALRKQGYQVTEVASADAAFESWQKPDSYALLVTDVVMPQRSGVELVKELRAKFPAIKVLFISGYIHNTLKHHGVNPDIHRILFKPFTFKDLANAVRHALDEKPQDGIQTVLLIMSLSWRTSSSALQRL